MQSVSNGRGQGPSTWLELWLARGHVSSQVTARITSHWVVPERQLSGRNIVSPHAARLTWFDLVPAFVHCLILNSVKLNPAATATNYNCQSRVFMQIPSTGLRHPSGFGGCRGKAILGRSVFFMSHVVRLNSFSGATGYRCSDSTLDWKDSLHSHATL